MEKTAYIILGILALLWLGAVVVGFVAIFPVGILGLAGLVAIALLFVTVVRDRLRNKEDDYYSTHVDQ